MQHTKSNAVKVVLTGGHAATPAAAVSRVLKSRNKNWELIWIGATGAVEGKKVPTLESVILPGLGVKFLPLITGRIQRRFTRHTIPSILKIPIGFFQSLYYLLKLKPGIIVSFGGYVSVPVVVAGKILGIPVVLHEQTAAAGRASIFTSRFADVVAISRETSLKYFPAKKCILTGNPVNEIVFDIKPKSAANEVPTIYITGGSRGSQTINDVVKDALPELLKKFKVIHQTGELDFMNFSGIKDPNYKVYKSLGLTEQASVYSNADIIVGRSGANTVSEVMAIKRPAIFIPLPISYLDEQTRNAEEAVKFGIAVIIPQSKFNKTSLIDGIGYLLRNYKTITGMVSGKTSPDKNASVMLCEVIEKNIR